MLCVVLCESRTVLRARCLGESHRHHQQEPHRRAAPSAITPPDHTAATTPVNRMGRASKGDLSAPQRRHARSQFEPTLTRSYWRTPALERQGELRLIRATARRELAPRSSAVPQTPGISPDSCAFRHFHRLIYPFVGSSRGQIVSIASIQFTVIAQTCAMRTTQEQVASPGRGPDDMCT